MHIKNFLLTGFLLLIAPPSENPNRNPQGKVIKTPAVKIHPRVLPTTE